jgi:hypothetical protein
MKLRLVNFALSILLHIELNVQEDLVQTIFEIELALNTNPTLQIIGNDANSGI